MRWPAPGGAQQAKTQPQPRKSRALSQHQSENVASAGTQRHANSNFMAALRYPIGNNSVDPHCCQHQCQTGEYSQQFAYQLRAGASAVAVYYFGRVLSSAGHRPLLHSYLSASIGSTFVARRAGKYDAISATPVMTSRTTAKVTGSVGRILNSRLAIKRVTASAPPSPSVSPNSVITTASRISNCTMPSGTAPRAMRIPISCVRWEAKYATTP